MKNLTKAERFEKFTTLQKAIRILNDKVAVLNLSKLGNFEGLSNFSIEEKLKEMGYTNDISFIKTSERSLFYKVN